MTNKAIEIDTELAATRLRNREHALKRLAEGGATKHGGKLLATLPFFVVAVFMDRLAPAFASPTALWISVTLLSTTLYGLWETNRLRSQMDALTELLTDTSQAR